MRSVKKYLADLPLMRQKKLCYFCYCLLLLPWLAGAEADSTGKYWLWRPVPRAQMREFSLDRPDVTESPYSVDAGHFQFETDLVKYTRSNDGGMKDTRLSLNYINLKVGLTATSDFQVVVESWHRQKSETPSGDALSKGVGDITLRLKQNIFGNDTGNFALGVLPYVAFIRGEARPEFGLAVPFAAGLGRGWDLGAMVQGQLSHQPSGSYSPDFLATLTLSHNLVGNLDLFSETYATYTAESKEVEPFLNGGFVFSAGDYFKFDAGVFYGLRSFSSRSVFLGMSFRY